MATATALSLRVKPFGKDGVRVLYTGGAEGTVLEVRQQQQHKPSSSSSSEDATTIATATDSSSSSLEEESWAVHADAALAEGAIVVKPSNGHNTRVAHEARRPFRSSSQSPFDSSTAHRGLSDQIAAPTRSNTHHSKDTFTLGAEPRIEARTSRLKGSGGARGAGWGTRDKYRCEMPLRVSSALRIAVTV